MLDIRGTEAGLTLTIRVVPNARKDEIVGLVGQRLKVRVSAPLEDGKANKAVCKPIANSQKTKLN
jgi:uncharacterized protein (TIGR00251 family)